MLVNPLNVIDIDEQSPSTIRMVQNFNGLVSDRIFRIWFQHFKLLTFSDIRWIAAILDLDGFVVGFNLLLDSTTEFPLVLLAQAGMVSY